MAAPAERRIPKASGCVAQDAGATPGAAGLEPAQLQAAYGLSPLISAGANGAGQRVAILTVGNALDLGAWTAFSDCFGPFATPHEQVVGGGTPTPGGEGTLDPVAVTMGAPGAQIYMFESASDYQPGALPGLLSAALDPDNTGGVLVDSITASVGGCESGYSVPQRAQIDPLLQQANSLGVKVFMAAGDGGSAGIPFGGSGCPFWPFDPTSPPNQVAPGLGYPSSSPYVTAVGGTVLHIGQQEERVGSPAGGPVTGEVVWYQSFPPNEPTDVKKWFAGGGGRSSVFTIADDAPWQQAVGLSGAESKPDIAALAGSPFYSGPWFGTSGASPLMAGAFATLDDYVQMQGAAKTTNVNALLYGLAADPATYQRAFFDITEGNNDPFHTGCCTATPGYDSASGLGSVRFDGLAEVLLADRPPPTSSSTADTTTESSENSGSETSRSTSEATTDPPDSTTSSEGGSTSTSGSPPTGPTNRNDGTLAATGFDGGAAGVTASLLLGAGLLLVWAHRRRVAGEHTSPGRRPR